MATGNKYDVIIVGGSYSGLAAGMALGRAMRKVLIIDGAKPCNRQTPFSHNFLTQDGIAPSAIAAIGRHQLEAYPTVQLMNDEAVAAQRTENGFEIVLSGGKAVISTSLIFATGIVDTMPPIPGFAECWGISVLHCPYCHGYEVRGMKTGILGDGQYAYDFSALISNWTKQLTLYTNGKSVLDSAQKERIEKHGISIVEKKIVELLHTNGNLHTLVFDDGTNEKAQALYARPAFGQHSSLPASLGCAFDQDGYLIVDHFQQTTAPGIYACGDNSSRIRTVANAVATGTTAGMMLNRQLCEEAF